MGSTNTWERRSFNLIVYWKPIWVHKGNRRGIRKSREPSGLSEERGKMSNERDKREEMLKNGC